MPRRRTAAVVAVVLVVGAVGVLAALAVTGPSTSPGTPGTSASGSLRPVVPDPAGTASPADPADPADPGTTLVPCPAARETAASAVTVLSFNVHGALGRDGTYDVAQVAAEIREWDADVVLLQEVHRFRARSGLDDMPAELGRLTGMSAVFGRNVSRGVEAAGYPRSRSGTAALSRLPVLGSTNLRLPNRPGHQPRGLLRLTVDLDGRAIDVWGTHLDPGRGDIRLLQVRGIRDAVRERAGRGGRPFLLAGDLNTEPDSPAMSVVARFATDPWPAVGRGVGETVLPREPRRRIDYVLHGPGWEALRSETLLSQVADHRAVRTTLALAPTC